MSKSSISVFFPTSLELRLALFPINGVRFKGSAKYPFPKGQIPAADAVLQQIRRDH